MAILTAVAGGAVWLLSPATPLLFDGSDARWVRRPEPFDLVARPDSTELATFCRDVTAGAGEGTTELRVLVFRVLVEANLDGQPLAVERRRLDDWRQAHRLELGSLAPGPHRLCLVVVNRRGPAVVRVDGDRRFATAAGDGAASGWEVARADGSWVGAEPAGETVGPPPVALDFPTPLAALRRVALPLALIATACFGLALWPPRRLRRRLRPRHLAMSLAAAWIVLAVHNVARIQPWQGFDAEAHIDYVNQVDSGRLPLAPDGWQAFQPPLYYAVAAISRRLLGWLPGAAGAQAPILVNVGAGIALIALSWMALRLAFPARPTAQAAGVLLAGSLGMSLTMAFYPGNEPLAAALVGAAFVATLRYLRRPSRGGPWLVGLLLGFALLAKVTALLVAPPLALAIAWRAWKRSGRRAAVMAFGATTATTLLVAGWVYLRNWMVLGRPFIGGWDAARGIVWWQDPGYRTLGQLVGFGRSLMRPILASTAGLWDSLYSTLWIDASLGGTTTRAAAVSWSWDWQLATVWLALVPTCALLAGVVAAARRSTPALRLALTCMGVELGALVALYIRLPIYTTAKASYLLGLVPVLAMLVGAGISPLQRSRMGRGLALGGLATWAVASLLGFWIR